MALHVIRDSQGRVEKYLTEKEFQKYKENKGCFKYIVLAVLILGAVGFFKECLPSSSSKGYDIPNFNDFSRISGLSKFIFFIYINLD